MHCPACDKEFSPVHSRCPDCNGWLRTSKPSVGAKASTVRAGSDLENAPTHKLAAPVANMNGANVTLPSRPTKPAPPAAPAPASGPPPLPRPASHAPAQPAPPRSAGLSGDWGAPPAATPPAPALEPPSGRGALGSGWEASGNFAAPAAPAPASQWGANNATEKMSAWGAPGGPSAGLGNSPAGLGGPGPGNGFGSGPGQFPQSSAGLGAGPAGFGASPGGLGGPTSSPNAQNSATAGGFGNPAMGPPGGGWLGGDSAAPSGPGYAPVAPPRSPAWGDNSGEETGPVSHSTMPSSAPVSDAPALALPDHTVFVDMEAPWEDDTPKGGSNKVIYIVLACLVLGLTAFSGYIYWQRHQLETKAPVVAKESTADSLTVGETYLKMAKKAYNAKKWDEAQQSAELARDLIAPLKVAPPAKVKEVKNFFAKATNRCAQANFDKATRAMQAGDSRQALAYCRDAANMYKKLPNTRKLQAKAYGLEGRIYEGDNDRASAESAYRKAAQLNPGGGYTAAVNRVRRSGAPAVAQPQAGDPSQPAVEQPTLGGNPAYPTGSSSGGYHPSAPQPAAQPSGPSQPASKPRPVNTYVPPKKTTPKRKSDQLPTY